jgi:glycerol-3-phosphate dehydrogenase
MSKLTKKTYDLVVIGGGIAGIGVAREAAKRGLSVVLLEQERCARATSDSSLRIIHGGLRYLQGLQPRRVIESLKDQVDLLKSYPDVIKPFPCLMPLNRFGLKSRFPAGLAIWFYSKVASAIKGEPYPGKILSAGDVERRCSVLAEGGAPYGGMLWYDAMLVKPHDFAGALLQEFAEAGGELRENSEVIAVNRVDEGVFQVQAQSGAPVQSSTVVNASGAWLRSIKTNFDLPQLKLTWAKAFNIELKHQIDPEFGIGVESAEGRLFFLTPRVAADGSPISVVGTWYSPYEGNPRDCTVSEVEIEAALDELNASLKSVSVNRADVLRVESGVLPAYGVRGRDPLLYGAAKLLDTAGYIEVLSTKYTTFQSQGRKVFKMVKKHL